MFDHCWHLMTKEQCSRAGQISQHVQYIKRITENPKLYPPIPEGLQMGGVLYDMRYGGFDIAHFQLFQADSHHNRYRWMKNCDKQNRLIGWHDALRDMATVFRPVIHPLRLD